VPLAALEGELVDAVERLWPSVVRVDRGAPPGPAGTNPFPPSGSGSGLIWSSEGLLVTNEHVVRGRPPISVTLSTGESLDAAIVGADPLTDIALLRLPRRQLAGAPRARSSELRVGQLALAVGHSLGLPGGPTVSLGVVSALHRPIPGSDFVLEGLLQTDAAINPGNSGGPLADLTGAVIGLNSATVPFAQGVGFAVPVDTVGSIVRELETTGRVRRGWIGIHGVGVDAAVARRYRLTRMRGVLVAEVVQNGPADRAGLRPGDVVTRVESSGIRGFHDLVTALSTVPIGGAVDLAFDRSGREKRTVLQVAESPATGP